MTIENCRLLLHHGQLFQLLFFNRRFFLELLWAGSYGREPIGTIGAGFLQDGCPSWCPSVRERCRDLKTRIQSGVILSWSAPECSFKLCCTFSVHISQVIRRIRCRQKCVVTKWSLLLQVWNWSTVVLIHNTTTHKNTRHNIACYQVSTFSGRRNCSSFSYVNKCGIIQQIV